jgi:signal transduction histidine kinase
MSKSCWLWALLLCTGYASADTQASASPLWSQLRIAVDHAAQFTPDQAWARTQANDAITLQQPNQVVAAPNAPPHWAGFRWPKAQPDSDALWLSLKSPTQDHSQVWVRVGDQAWQAWPDMQQSQQGTYLFPVWILPTQTHDNIDVLVRLQGVNRIQFPLDLQTPARFVQQHWRLVLLMGAVLAVPLLLVLYALSLMSHIKSRILSLFVLMAVCEIICASWISGLLCLIWPDLTRAQAAMLGSFSYWVLFVVSIHHARAFLNTSEQRPRADKVLQAGAWLWSISVPVCFWLQPDWLRSLLLIGGTVHACAMLLLAWHSKQQQASTALTLFASMWLVYVTSVVVYWLYRVFEWPLFTTLGVQFVQGALMASLMGWSACLQVVEQRMDLQRRVGISQARHRWFAAAQHDLWQPLQSMQLFARALLQVSPEKRPGLVASMQLASQSVDDYMQHLRYWADEDKAVESARLPMQTLTANDLLQPLVHEFAALAQMRFVSLRSPPCRAQVRVNQLAVQRMVRNLLANALQYTSAGGRVLLGCKRQGNLLWLLCVDNGSGMNSMEAQACFNAFTRLKSDDEGVHHLGLGLFSVKLLAQENNMPTRLHSIEGRGTVVGFGMALILAD